MFSKIIPRIKEFYYLPAVFLTFGKGFTGGYDEYKKNYTVSLEEHTFCCMMGTITGAISGAFLGLTWPISLPIFIGRCIDKK
jgi:hypothetical protein